MFFTTMHKDVVIERKKPRISTRTFYVSAKNPKCFRDYEGKTWSWNKDTVTFFKTYKEFRMDKLKESLSTPNGWAEWSDNHQHNKI